MRLTHLFQTPILSVLLVCGGATQALAHSGDHSFFDLVYESRLAEAGGLPASGKQLKDTAKQMADLLGVVPNQEGRTLLPAGTVCDSLEVEGGRLTARFTLPENLPADAFAHMPHETAGELLRHYFAEDLALTELVILARLGTNGTYQPMDAYGPRADQKALSQGTDWFEPDGPGPSPAPDYQALTKELAAAAEKNISGQGPVGTSSQPQGALSGRTVYFSAGHGWTWSGSSWGLQRPLLLDMNEDHGNIDQIEFFAQYLFNAGATVVAMRPIGHQPNEVVLDNVNATFTGSWSDSSNARYYGNVGAVRYRFASKNASETATATYLPNIPESGFYPVYTWVNYGSDRVLDQLYKIRHTGGTSEVRINHRRVGCGWIWLGTYYFNAGSSAATGSVVISNQTNTATGNVIIADAIRFGNGRGNIDRNGATAGGTSGYLRETEAARYWIESGHGQGGSSSVYDLSGSNDESDNVGTPPRNAAHMRRDDGQGYNGDIFLGWHTNASGSPARGCVALINNGSSGTPLNQAAFATLVANALDQDCLIEDANWEYTWVDRAAPTLASGYGEISNQWLNGEMCGTIIEVAFHHEPSDAALLRDPKVRNVAARACYKAIVRYFNQYDSNPSTLLPEPPVRVRAVNTGTGNVTVSWAAPPTGGAYGQAATGYRVYSSTNGYGYGLAATATGNSATITGLTPGTTYFFRVAAVNAGGESLPTESVAARVSTAGPASVLVVNGYDRLDRFNNVRETLPSMAIDRLRLRRNNSYDYVIQHGQAIASANRYFDSCSNEAVISSDVNLSSYDAVVWMVGEESTDDQTLDATERTKVQAFLNAGGSLFISGAEIAWHLGAQSGAPSFLTGVLKAGYAGDDGGSYQATGRPGTVFTGLTMNFGPSATMYDVDYPDQLTPTGGSVEAAVYTGGGSGTAAVQYAGAYRLVYLAFPFEAINSASVRNSAMQQVLQFLEPVPTGAGDWALFE